MIFTENLCKMFDEFTAVDGVNFEVQPGTVLALLGPNGAGKTTTVRLLTSVLKPTQGRAEVAGFDVVKEPKKVRSSVGVLTEHHGLYNRMRSPEYLDFYGQIHGMTLIDRRQRADKLLENFGLASDVNRRIGEYSKGMRQKLALVRALLHRPPVLLLDEPTSAMDPESARLVRDLIKELRSDERAVVICTHNLAEAEELADRIAIIRKGKIIANGSPDQLKDQLLGPPVFEVRFSHKLNGELPAFPEEVQILDVGEDWLHYKCDSFHELNPVVIERLVARKSKVLTLREIPRSLEKVYLHAVSEEGNHVG